jgi:stress-induced-phosphoprotein 1
MSAVDALKAKGNQAFAEKKFTEAVKFYTDAIDMDEDNFTLYSNRSGSYCAAGKYNLAEADARKVIQLKPDWVRGYTRLGAALTGQDKWQDAVTTYEKAHELDPSNQNITEDLENARKHLQSSEKVDPFANLFSPQALAALRFNPQIAPLFQDPSFVQFFNEFQANPQIALQKYQQDPRMRLLFQALIQNMGGQFGAGGDDDEDEVVAPPPAPAAAPSSPPPKQAEPPATEAEREKNLGNDAFRAGKLDEALEHYDKAIELDPHNVTFYNNKAVVLSKLGRYQESIDLVKKAIEDGRAHGASYDVIAKAYQKIASAYNGLNNLDAAIEALGASLLEKQDPAVKKELRALQDKRAKQKAQEYENPELAEKARQDGNTAFKDGKFPEAVALYSEAIKRAPRSAPLFSNRAAAYSKLGEFPMAIADCEKAIELDGNFSKAYTRKAYCHYMMKEYYKARDCYNQALQIDPNNADALGGLDEISAALAKQRYQAPDQEQIRRAMADPEIQRIVQDPGMQQILKDLQENPGKAGHYFADPKIRDGLSKLRDAGILHF